MQGAPITIRCDCGRARPVRYGERWTCEGCSRTWNTTQIPAEEYWGVMRRIVRYRRIVWGLTAALVAPLAVLGFLVSTAFFVLLIAVLGGLYLLVLPRWRARVLAQMQDRPSWKLSPE